MLFKSIEYKLILYIGLLILSVIGGAYFAINEMYSYLIGAVVISIYILFKLHRHYNKFNQNIVFLLNALENGDYSFHFAESRLSRREIELNRMMNRIKEILARAKKEVIENERFLSLILESVSTGIIILDDTNHIQTTNKAVHELLGMPVFTHINQLKNLDESFPDLFRNLKVGESQAITIVNDREEVQINLSASTITMKKGVMKVITLSNIGNALEAKEMESWIRLIRVMTHEIMNSIAPITSLSETLLFSYKMNKDVDLDATELKENTIEALQTISTTAKGLESFVNSYRQFTGVPNPQLAEVQLGTLLEHIQALESVSMDDRGISYYIEDPYNVTINADESQIAQILINLIKNAIESMSTKVGGQIIMKVIDTEKYTDVQVRNNGEPIPAEIVAHIFIPFFTTKDMGTGIGLSVSRYIMRLHGGNLKHHTEGEWTVFTMRFEK